MCEILIMQITQYKLISVQIRTTQDFGDNPHQTE